MNRKLNISHDSTKSKKKCAHNENTPQKKVAQMVHILGLNGLSEKMLNQWEAMLTEKGPKKATLTKVHKYLTHQKFESYRTLYRRMP